MIYFVEDDENIRELVIYTLNSISLDAVGFSRPSHFWEAMEREMPRLILLDIMLPEEDGIQILKKTARICENRQNTGNDADCKGQRI